MDLNNIEYTHGALAKSSGVGAAVAPTKFNPEFVSQFDINISVIYSKLEYSLEGGDLVLNTQIIIDPSELLDILKTDVAFFLFGKSDKSGGFKRNDQLLSVNNWILNSYRIKDDNVEIYSVRRPNTTEVYTFSSTADINGKVRRGDAMQSYYYYEFINSNTFNFYLAEIIIECKQVAYGTLLDSTSSDRFTLNNIRYKIPDISKIAQFEKQLKVTRQSLFGKLSTDDLSPASFQLPNNPQVNIVDIPLIKGIDKESSISSYLEYDVGEILLSMFVETQRKVVEK